MRQYEIVGEDSNNSIGLISTSIIETRLQRNVSTEVSRWLFIRLQV